MRRENEHVHRRGDTLRDPWGQPRDREKTARGIWITTLCFAIRHIRYVPSQVHAWMQSSIDLDSGRQKFGGVYATLETIVAAVIRGADPAVAEATIDAQILQRSEDQFPQGLSLRELTYHFARRAGLTMLYQTRDIMAQMRVLKAAAINASASGPSTMSLESVLSNVANKYVRAGFTGVDRTAIDAIHHRAPRRILRTVLVSPDWRSYLSQGRSWRRGPAWRC